MRITIISLGLLAAIIGSDLLGADGDPAKPLVLGTPEQIIRSPIVGLAALADNRTVLIQDGKGISTVDLKSGKATATAKFDPFPERLTVKLPRESAFATHRGTLAISGEGGTAYAFDALGVYEYALPLGSADRKRVANRAEVVPLMGIVHIGKNDFAFGVNSRGELFECRPSQDKADSNTGLVKCDLPRVDFFLLTLPRPAMTGGGKYVALGGSGTRGGKSPIQIWDSVAKTDLFPIGVEEHILALAIPPDGKTLASISFGPKAPGKAPLVQLFSLPDGKELASWPTTGRRLAFSADGSVLAVVNSMPTPKRSRIELCEPLSGKVLQEFLVPGDGINCFDFTPDGKTFLAGGESGVLYQWSVQTGKPQGPPTSPPPAVSSVAFAADGGFTTISSGGAVRQWSDDGRETKSIVVHNAQPVFVVRSRDGRALFTSGDNNDGTIRAYDAGSGKELHRLELPGRRSVATSLAPSPDGKFLYAGVTNEGIVRIDVDSFKIVATLKPKEPSPASFGGAANNIVFVGDERMLTRDFDRLRVWDLKEDREIRSSSFSGAAARYTPVHIAASPNGRNYLTARGGLVILTFDIARIPTAGSIRIPNPNNLTATAVIYINNKTLAVGDSSGKIRLVDVDKKEPEGTIIGEHLGPVTCLAVSPDGKRLISGSADTSAKVWKLP